MDISFDKNQGVHLLDCMAKRTFGFIKDFQTFFQKVVPIFCISTAINENFCLSTSLSAFGAITVLNFGHLNRCVVL